MHRYRPRTRFLASSLSFVAGFVDATAFLKLGGFFVSFMSGNTTRLGVGIGTHSEAGLVAGGIILTFVLGVVLGSLVAQFADERRETAVLSLVAVLLGFAALCGNTLTGPAVAAMALAMGAENAVFAREGDVQIGLTYMTGALVKMGQRIAGALTGGDPLAFLPYLQLWLGLAVGAATGTVVYGVWNLAGLWFAVAATCLFAVLALRFDFSPIGEA